MEMLILTAGILFVVGVIGGHLARLRGGASAERRFWLRGLALTGISIALSLMVYGFVSPAYERLASHILMCANGAIGFLASRGIQDQRVTPASRLQD